MHLHSDLTEHSTWKSLHSTHRHNNKSSTRVDNSRRRTRRNNKASDSPLSNLHFLAKSSSNLPLYSALVSIISMRNRAHSLAGIAARSRSPKIEPHSDFGPPSSPHHNPSPGGISIKSEHDMIDSRHPSPSGFFIKPEHDMSDSHHPSLNGIVIKSEHDMSDEINPSPSQLLIKLEDDMLDIHSPSPSGSFIKFEHDMSGDHKPLADEDDSPSETRIETRSKTTRKRSERIRAVHHHLNKEVDETHELSEEAKRRLTRIAKTARYECRSSAKKRLKHLQWAARTLTAAAFTPYVRLFNVDGQVTRLIRRMELDQQPVGEGPNEAFILKLLEKLSARERYRVLRTLATGMSEEGKVARDNFNMWALTLLDEAWHPKFERVIKEQQALYQKTKAQKLPSRPLAEVPFDTTERDLVEGLLSLLMRVSESVARRAWPEKPQHASKDMAKEIRKIHWEMKRDEGFLDSMRARIEIGWRDYVKARQVHRLSTPDLIDKVRALDEKVLGMPLLPSKLCILHIIDIVNKGCPVKNSPPASDRCAMPAELLKEFEENLHMRDVYDEWRATNPPDSELFWDTAVESIKRKYHTT
jgi:hypothetical protein